MKALAQQLVRYLKPLKSIERHTPKFVREWGHGFLVDLDIDPKPFAGFSTKLRPTMVKVAQTRFYRYGEHHAEQTRIPGWLSPKERQILYALGRWLPGPITEIGSWAGLSTTAIARGIKDSEQPKEFRTYDLKLSEDQFRPVTGGIGLFLPNDDISHGFCTLDSYRLDIQPVLGAPGGSNGLLKRHLADLGLLGFTQIFVGDFRHENPMKSQVLFCDCLHDEHEINQNAPALRPWLDRGSILTCHDIGGKPELIEMMRAKIPMGNGVTIDSTYIAEIL